MPHRARRTPSMMFRVSGHVAVLILYCMLAQRTTAQNPRIHWRTGDSLEDCLRQPETVYWPKVPLAEALTNLSHAHRVAILLDRRVDPSRNVDISSREKPLGEILHDLAAQEKLGMSRLGPVLYLGPQDTANRLRSIVEWQEAEVEKLAPPARDAFRAKKPLQWPDFTSPRQLILDTAREAGLVIPHPERVPHDLWARGDLPALSLVERLSLLTAQFDLMWIVAPDGRRLALVPIPADLAPVRSFALIGDGSEQMSRYRAAASAVEFKILDGRLFAKGRSEDLDAIERMESPGPPSRTVERAQPDPASLGQKRFTVTVQNKPLRDVVENLATQLQLDLQVDWALCRSAGIAPDRLVSFEVRDADVDQLFRAMLDPVGLRHTRQGQTLRIAPSRR